MQFHCICNIHILTIIQQKNCIFHIANNMGKKIQNYCLQQVIGEGQFGKVYKAINQKTQQIVAVKVIKVEKFKMSPKLQEFTINEIQTLSKIQDTTNIVKFIEILKTANNYYFVYEFCNGGTLEQEIKNEGYFKEEKALGYFRDLLKAFRMLIRHNIMHRDIKPSNILLNNGVIKLADFGFCKPLKDSRDLAQTMLGSPIYMAPEILKGEVYTMKADIWSLGVVLYEMLYGYCPFEQKTIARLINLIDEGTVTFPSHIKISSKMYELLNRMLVKDQFKRINWQQIFDFDFFEKKDKPQKAERVERASQKHSQVQFIKTLSNAQKIQNNNPFSKKQKERSKSKDKAEQSQGYYMNLNKRQSSNNSITNLSKNQSSQKSDSFTLKSDNNTQKGLSINNNYSNLNHVNTVSPRNYPTKINSQSENYFSVQQQTLVPSKYGKVNSQDGNKQKKKIISLLNDRTSVYKGIKMVQKLLNQSNSKLTVNICCFLIKKVASHSKNLNETATKFFNEKQNYLIGSELKKVINIIFDQKVQLTERVIPFENQMKNILEPQDILYLRYAQEESLTQQKDGLVQLLQIDDYLNGASNSYSKLSKKQLLEQYEKRVLRKS